MLIAKSAIFRISVGMLIVIGSGLVGITSYLAVIGAQSEANTRKIASLESRSEQMNSIQTDIAVIKNELVNINKKLDSK